MRLFTTGGRQVVRVCPNATLTVGGNVTLQQPESALQLTAVVSTSELGVLLSPVTTVTVATAVPSGIVLVPALTSTSIDPASYSTPSSTHTIPAVVSFFQPWEWYTVTVTVSYYPMRS